jgi:uncharacterized protein
MNNDFLLPDSHLMKNVLLFGRTCKIFGMDVRPDTFLDAARALNLINVLYRDDVYYTLRVLYVKKQSDLALFDKIFDAFWRSLHDVSPTEYNAALPDDSGESDTVVPVEPLQSDRPPREEGDSTWVVPEYSPDEVMRQKDFAAMTPEELAYVYHFIAQSEWRLGMRETRRYVSGKGRRLDPRRMLRHNLRYTGEFFDFPTRTHKIKRRSLLLLCDVSGSMERYTRILLHLAHTLAGGTSQVETFVFSTRLTHITPVMRHRRIETALTEIGKSVTDWSGGTRIGDALHTFNYHWRWRTAGTSTVVLLITDGWDRGDPELLRQETALLQRSSYRLIWLNPLLGTPEYQPLTRGAQAMINSVDDFLPIHNLVSLEMLIRELNRVDWGRRRHFQSAARAG